MKPVLEFVGEVRSPLTRMEDCPKLESENAPPAILHLFPGFERAAKDLKEGAEIIVLTWLDKADRATLETHPRDNKALPMAGVFSTRSPDRPNPIGMHRVTIVEMISSNEIRVAAMETLDKTPVVDIKPVLK